MAMYEHIGKPAVLPHAITLMYPYLQQTFYLTIKHLRLFVESL